MSQVLQRSASKEFTGTLLGLTMKPTLGFALPLHAKFLFFGEIADVAYKLFDLIVGELSLVGRHGALSNADYLR
jgi:hypothetical protein